MAGGRARVTAMTASPTSAYFNYGNSIKRIIEGTLDFLAANRLKYSVGICLKSVYWVLFIFLLLTPLVVNLLFISNIHYLTQKAFRYYRRAPANTLLKDILFIEGFFLIIFGALAGEYIWRYFRNRKNSRLSEQPKELKFGWHF
jgi:hypothetical protein